MNRTQAPSLATERIQFPYNRSLAEMDREAAPTAQRELNQILRLKQQDPERTNCLGDLHLRRP